MAYALAMFLLTVVGFLNSHGVHVLPNSLTYLLIPGALVLVYALSCISEAEVYGSLGEKNHSSYII